MSVPVSDFETGSWDFTFTKNSFETCHYASFMLKTDFSKTNLV